MRAALTRPGARGALRRTAAVLLLALTATSLAEGQRETQRPLSPPAAASSAASDTALLVVHNRVIVVLRAPLGALSAAERAAGASQRIEAFVDTATRSAAADTVHIRAIPDGALVMLGARPFFTITHADVDTLRGETLDGVATLAATRLRQILAIEREERSPARLIQGIALSAFATLLFFIVLRVIRRIRALALGRLPDVAGPRLHGFSVAGFSLFTAEQLLGFVRRVIDLAAWAAGLFAAYVWLVYVLTRFPYSRPWGEALGAYLTSTVKGLAFIALGGIPGLFTVVLIFIATRWVTRVVGSFFDAVEGRRVAVPWVHPETANPTKRLSIAMLWLFAIVIAYPYVPGSGSDVFKGVSVFAGLVISLGSSGLVSQAMSGLVLMYSRALHPGDYVRIGETEGVVTALGLLSTKVRTLRQEEVTVPNAVVVGASVKNYSRLCAEQGVIVHTSVTIGYDTPWRQVEALLLRSAERTEGVERQPSPFVFKTSLGDFYVEYTLNVFVAHPEQRMRILSTLHANILDAFNEFGVQIMSPHFEGEPSRPLVVPRERWYAAPAVSSFSESGDGRAPAQPEGPSGPAERNEARL
jgi:small-conductance mechanosensitive channel